uniref:Glutaredoxin-like protein n=1 Tax=Arcella intermedia TaxID=1963864 RepID=A0A6B2LVP7_9EUKA
MTLFAKPFQCSLCANAKRNILQVSKQLNDRIVVQEVDITEPGNEKYFEMYKYDIPVGLIGKKEIFRHRIEPHQLLQIIQNMDQQLHQPPATPEV